MENKYNTFFNLFNLTLVDLDNYYGDQCVDLVQFWNRFLGIKTVFAGNAIDLANQTLGGLYKWIPNTPDNFPQMGDIIVWGSPYGKYTDNNGVVKYAGHTGIATGRADQNTLDVFQQNDPTNSNCHVKIYSNYVGILGWLRINNLPLPIPSGPTDQTKYDFGSIILSPAIDGTPAVNQVFGIMELQAAKSVIQDEAKTIFDLKKNNDDLQKQLEECQNKPQIPSPSQPGMPIPTLQDMLPFCPPRLLNLINTIWGVKN